MDINNVIKDYVQCVTNNAVTLPNGGTWISALCIYYNITEPINGSWIQAYCVSIGIPAPINGSWTIALALSLGITQPKNGSWWYAIADEQCNGVPSTPCIWGVNQNRFGQEARVWSSVAVCGPPVAGPELWEQAGSFWEVEPDNWEIV